MEAGVAEEEGVAVSRAEGVEWTVPVCEGVCEVEKEERAVPVAPPGVLVAPRKSEAVPHEDTEGEGEGVPPTPPLALGVRLPCMPEEAVDAGELVPLREKVGLSVGGSVTLAHAVAMRDSVGSAEALPQALGARVALGLLDSVER